MSEPSLRIGDRVTVWRGMKTGPGIPATVIAEPSAMGGQPVVRVRFRTPSTDYIALTHVEPRGSNVLEDGGGV